TTPTHFPNADPEAQESHDRIWTGDHNKPSIVVSSCDRNITPRRSRPLLHAVRRRASKKQRQIAGNLTGELANAHTRKNYLHAVRRFLAWCDHPERQIPLVQITPGHLGDYLAGLERSTPTKKLHLAALRKFFDRMVVRHVVILNPAASVRAERHQVVEGKTPEIAAKQIHRLLESIDTGTIVGLRDRAILAVLIYTATRVGAVAKLTWKSLRHDGSQYTLRFSEKGGKAREIPVRHDLEQVLLAYVRAGQIDDGSLFRTVVRR